MPQLALDASLLILLATLAFPSVSDFIVLVSCIFSRRPVPLPEGPRRPSRLLVLIPAHNEVQLIGRVVESLLAAPYPSSQRRILVIADNCDDRTAEVARLSGARCLERLEPDKPGKPQALAWAIERALNWDDFEWDAAVIVDADSIVDGQFLQAIGAVPELRRNICQARNGVENPDDTWLTLLGDLLVRARYDVLFECKRRFGLNCPAAGNGTAIGRELLNEGWKAFSLAEGWELYARAIIENRNSIYVAHAQIASQEARSLSQSATQRQRWTAGRWHILTQLGLEIAAAGNVNILQRLDALCELSNPGPVSHMASLLILLMLTILLVEPPGLIIGILIAVIAVAPYLIAYSIAIYRHPRPWAVTKALSRLPLYALWRLPKALAAVSVPRDGLWRKTKRH